MIGKNTWGLRGQMNRDMHVMYKNDGCSQQQYTHSQRQNTLKRADRAGWLAGCLDYCLCPIFTSFLLWVKSGVALCCTLSNQSITIP
ncbi:Uncharacterized protein TCM_032328 [Theobroma cacao]|uniref:Uncharacterized protein n=1 Tax=Theobroma cacao TaxID=3641 RepID=A0A061F9Z3_THECC|nr:Uncharacterized protein TCM_032328 [Theobroma cacao]